ncbi:MAG: hypothetical protein QOJ99_5550, partial [Bryobacterales bacterium]|nr:hypothetical protein [Bryobacterales bacterium]
MLNSKGRLTLILLAVSICLAAGKGDKALLTAEKSITPGGLLSHISILASDEFGGRAPGSPGDEKTVAYLIGQCKKLGLKPGNPDGSYIQKVTLWGISSQGTVTLSTEGNDLPLVARQDYLLSSQMPKAE